MVLGGVLNVSKVVLGSLYVISRRLWVVLTVVLSSFHCGFRWFIGSL